MCINQDLINLYDDYTHTPLTRSKFIRRLVVLPIKMSQEQNSWI